MKSGKFKSKLRDILINPGKRKKLTNSHFSIICNDCIGGMVSHDLKQQFCSPTINMWCSAGDYIKFVSNLEYYLSLEPTECPNDAYPIMAVGDVKWHCLHYKSFEEARDKWNIRKQRVDYANLYFMFNDRNGCTEKEIRAFDRLPYAHKVCFVHKKWPEYKSTFYIPGSEDKDCIDNITAYVNKLSCKRKYDYFDVVSFLNVKN